MCVLNEQIEAQEEKIRDMEICIKEYKHKATGVDSVSSQVRATVYMFSCYCVRIFTVSV